MYIHLGGARGFVHSASLISAQYFCTNHKPWMISVMAKKKINTNILEPIGHKLSSIPVSS